MDVEGREVEVHPPREDLPADGDFLHSWRAIDGRIVLDLVLFAEIRPQWMRRYALRFVISGEN